MLHAQQSTELDAIEIRNSTRVELNTWEAGFKAESREQHTGRRRSVDDHSERVGDVTDRLKCSRNAEAPARANAKSVWEYVRTAIAP